MDFRRGNPFKRRGARSSSSKFGLVLFLLISFSFSAQCQDAEALHQQLTFSCDNNFFLFNGDDGYYTNGLFLKYSRLSRKQDIPSSKIIFSYEVGQQIFNAHSRKILPVGIPSLNIPGGVEQIDRPVAGYLFGKVTRTSFHNDRRMLQLGISVGTIGKNSLGEAVQEFWHRVINVKSYWNWVWDYQVSNEVGINAQGTFAYALLKREQLPYVQITPISQATLGTTFTNLSQSVLFQIGRLRPMSSSSFWQSRLQFANDPLDTRKVEFFFFYKPELQYHVYNATIQGGMFSHDDVQITSDVKPFVLSHQIGVQFSIPRFSLGYSVTFQSKEAQTQFYNQSYASLVGSFCF
ncbi:MAG TPA: lipid A deacylase LpxR family protein [Cyclobacteriaceae bacterium]|nr:lipid A deacylase LpxR family protein [Cyclobacteriaceae bacterium]